MASIDLSTVFDLVNVKLLIKRLKIIGLPMDIIHIIEIWLSRLQFYSVFNSILFDIAKLTNFGDGNFIIAFNPQINTLIVDLKIKLEMITKRLKDFGLKVNKAQTEICLFHHNDSHKLQLPCKIKKLFLKKQ
jgi:hypothetical protein